MAKFD